MGWSDSDRQLEERIARIVDGRVDQRVRELVRGNLVREEQAPRSLPLSKLAKGGAASGDGLVFDGTMWVPQDVATQAELDAVSAVADAAIPKAIGDAKGDLIGFSAADTPVRIAAAAGDGYALVSDSGETGGVGWVGPSAVSLYNPDYGGSATITNATERILDWNSEEYDYGGFHAAGSDAIIVPTGYSGVYHFDAQIYWNYNTAGGGYYVGVSVYNSSDVLQRTMYEGGNGNITGLGQIISMSKDVYLSAGERLRVRCYQNTGANQSMNTSLQTTSFSMHRVVAA